MMLYQTAQDWLDAPQKRVGVFGMSGLGKTFLSNMLRDTGDWFHYSVDYRIGTRYMGEHIVDNFKKHAMENPFLAELLRSDSIYIGSNITFENLAPLSTYLGKPGDPRLGGIDIDEYRRRQAQHHEAEVSALLDTAGFARRADEIYGYPHFICDTGGSICEVVDPSDPNDPVMTALSEACLMVWIKGSDDHIAELNRRFDLAPKPMCYQTDFLDHAWDDFLAEKSVPAAQIDPNEFIRATFARALAHRQPRYAAMAEWGVTVSAEDVGRVRNAQDFNTLIAQAISDRGHV